jgi:hypothetical protein
MGRRHKVKSESGNNDVIAPLLIFLFYIVWALILTYPLVFHLFSHIPLGDEKVGTVPLFNVWTLQWVIDQLVAGFSNLWDAPIFAPATGTFAFSETQPLSGVLAAPLWLGFQAPAVGYNAIVILFLTLNGWFAYWLLRSWKVAVLPAFLGGLLMASIPFVAQEMGVLQLIAVFGVVWSLLYLSRFLQHSALGLPVKRTGVMLALGTPVTFFTCSYYGLCSVFFLPLAFVFQCSRKLLTLKTARHILGVGLLILVLTGPILWTQQQRLSHYGFRRSEETVKNNSAQLQYYRNYLDHNIFYSQILGQKSGQGQRLFPGVGYILLGTLGLFGSSQKNVKRYLLLATLLALLLSLGLRLDMGGFVPYQWIRNHIPGFAQLRSPFRFAVLVQLHLALLAGLGLHNLGRWFSGQKSLILPVVTGLALVEVLALPLPLQAVPAPTKALPWQIWLNEQPRPVRIVMLPFASTNRVADFEQTVRWMLANRRLQGDMLNGYSGFFPHDHGQLRNLMLQFPTREGIALLKEWGVDYVVVYHHLANAPPPETMAQWLPLVFQDKSNNVGVYSIRGN